MSFLGGLHSLVDCDISDNTKTAIVVGFSAPGFNQGRDAEGRFFSGTCCIKKTEIKNSLEGLIIWRKSAVRMTDSTIENCKVGIMSFAGSGLELRNNRIFPCKKMTLNLQTDDFHADKNTYYSPVKFRVMKKQFTSEKWSEYQKASGNEKASKLLPKAERGI